MSYHIFLCERRPREAQERAFLPAGASQSCQLWQRMSTTMSLSGWVTVKMVESVSLSSLHCPL